MQAWSLLASVVGAMILWRGKPLSDPAAFIANHPGRIHQLSTRQATRSELSLLPAAWFAQCPASQIIDILNEHSRLPASLVSFLCYNPAWQELTGDHGKHTQRKKKMSRREAQAKAMAVNQAIHTMERKIRQLECQLYTYR